MTLDELAAAVRREADVPSRKVTDPFPEAARAAIRRLEDGIVASGETRQVAEHAATGVLLTRLPVAECVAQARRIVAARESE